MPSVNRAFYLVMQVEKQKHITTSSSSELEMSAFNATWGCGSIKSVIPRKKDFPEE